MKRFCIASLLGLIVSFGGPATAQAQLMRDFVQQLMDQHPPHQPKVITKARAAQALPPYTPPTSEELVDDVGDVAFDLSDQLQLELGQKARVNVTRKYSTKFPTQIETDCAGVWYIKLKPQWEAALAQNLWHPYSEPAQALLRTLIGRIPKYAVMRYGRYRFEWIDCRVILTRQPTPTAPLTAQDVYVFPDLIDPNVRNQKADGGVDLPRNKAYYRLNFRNKVRSLQVGRRNMGRRWGAFKAFHQAFAKQQKEVDPTYKNPCRGKSFSLPGRFTSLDAASERFVGKARSGSQNVVTSDNRFEFVSRRYGKITLCGNTT